MFQIVSESVFEKPAQAYVNTINTVGVMGAGIASEFKKRYPDMFRDYKIQCAKHLIKPGDCYIYKDKSTYLLGLAVKDDWRHWSTLEWIESSLKSLRLTMLENDIKSVNLPVLGGMNGKRGPYGKVIGFTVPPEKEELIELIKTQLEPFAIKFDVNIRLCIPGNTSVVKKQEHTLEEFFEL